MRELSDSAGADLGSAGAIWEKRLAKVLSVEGVRNLDVVRWRIQGIAIALVEAGNAEVTYAAKAKNEAKRAGRHAPERAGTGR